MIKKILIIGLLVLLIGCSKDEEILVEPEFLAYLAEFEAEAQLRSKDLGETMETLSVRFVDIDSDAAGQCITYTNGERVIEINRTSWNSLADSGRELLLFHELGHCVLNRGHLNDKNEDGQCSSIMRESTQTCPINYNVTTREAFLNELFK